MITIGIASIPSREDGLHHTLISLVLQADVIYVGLNGYARLPEWILNYPNVVPYFADNSKGDAEKFRYVDRNNGYYLAADDDLIFPKMYVKDMIKAVDKYNGLVSLHGRTYLSPVKSFKQWAGNYRCLNTVSEDVKVNLIGSGCCAFHTDRLKISIGDFFYPNMADCYLSRQAYLQGVPMIVLAHRKDCLRYCPPKDKKTIWNTTRNYNVHTKVLQSYLG